MEYETFDISRNLDYCLMIACINGHDDKDFRKDYKNYFLHCRFLFYCLDTGKRLGRHVIGLKFVTVKIHIRLGGVFTVS